MSIRTVEVDLADWTKLSTLIAAKDTNLGRLTNCQELTVVSPETNADGTRVDISSDPVNHSITKRLLKEEEYKFTSPLCYNDISTIDKYIRIVDGSSVAGVVTAGTARITLQFK